MGCAWHVLDRTNAVNWTIGFSLASIIGIDARTNPDPAAVGVTNIP